jgi:hypothetical protein
VAGYSTLSGLVSFTRPNCSTTSPYYPAYR